MFAQSDSKEVAFFFETDTIHVTQGNTFTNALWIKNTTEEPLHIKSLSAEQEYEGVLIAPNAPSTISAGEERRLFVKFIASNAFMKMKSNEISYNLNYEDGDGAKQVEKASFYKKTTENEEVHVYPFSRDNFVDPASPESNLSILVENTGYNSRSIQLEFESNFSGIKVTPNRLTVHLEGKEKKLVELKLSVREQNSYIPRYKIHVKTIDLISNKEFSLRNIPIQVLSSTTQIMQNTSFITDKNYVEMAYNKMGNNFDYMQLRANSKINLGKDTYATFNTITDYYLNQDAFSMYDTYLDFERKGSSVRIGNVFGNEYDYSVSGRGIKAIGDLGSHKTLEVLVVENEYNLYSNYISHSKSSTTVGTKYNFGSFDTFNGKVSYLYEYDPLLSKTSNVTHYTSNFKLNDKHMFRMEAGVSHEKRKLSKTENFGMTSSLNYDLKTEKWELSSHNTFASKSYAGMNRGSFYLYQNVGYRLAANKRLFLQYQNSQSKPEYLQHQNSDSFENNPVFNPYIFYSIHALKTGIQLSKSKWNIRLTPGIEKQKNITSFIDHNLLSYRILASAGTYIKDHNFDISLEYSYLKASKTDQNFSSLKSMVTYRYKRFSLNGTAQYNPYNLNELNYYSEETKDFINFNIYSSYNFTALQNNFTGNISAGINYSDLYKSRNTSLQGNAEYKITPSCASTASINYSQFNSLIINGYKGDDYQFKIGVKKYLSRADSEQFRRVNLQFFNDQNLNGVLDNGESVLADLIIRLGDYTAKTDKNGRVSFRNMPKGSYKLRVSGNTDLRMMQEGTIMVSNNINAQIALGKSNRVKGKLKEIRETYDMQDTDVRGIVVYAEDENGEKTYTAVDPNDNFEFLLKNGTYRIFIENQKYEYLKPSKTIHLENSDHPEVLIFEYKKKDRQIKVKKF